MSSGTAVAVTFKLYAGLSQYLPPGAVAHAVQLDLPSHPTPNQVIDAHGVPRRLAHLVLVNGVFVPPGERDSLILQDGDTLAVWPPVAGG